LLKKQGVSGDPVSALVQGQIPRIVRNTFFSYLANAVIVVVVTSAVGLLFGSTATSLSGLFEIVGFIIAGYAAIVYVWTKLRLSRGLAIQFYILALLGMSQAGLLYSLAAHGYASAGYWLRQSLSDRPCRCTNDRGEVVAFANKYLACLSCSRKLIVGSDGPKLWKRLGNAVLAAGILLYAFEVLLTGLATVPLNYLAWLLLVNGVAFSFPELGSRMSSGRNVRLPTRSV
jgi:hypothetical protein